MAFFTDVFSDVTKEGKKIPKEQYLKNGKYPIIDQGQNEIAGYTNEKEGIYTDVPAIIFGDHTRIIKFVTTPFFLGADGVKLLKIKDSANYAKYLYYALSFVKIPDTGYNRHFKWLKESEFLLPSPEKQQKIAEILDKVNDVIRLCKQMIEKLDLLIKSRFIEMFGDPVRNNKKWDVSPIAEVAPIVPCKMKAEGKVWLLNLDMIESGTGKIIQYLYVDIKNVGQSTCMFDEGNVLYSKLRPYLNKVVVPDKKGYCTSELLTLRPKKQLNKVFFANLLRSNAFTAYISEKVAGSKMPRVSMNDFKEFNCILPPIELQNQFVDFTQSIDKLQSSVRKVLEKAEILKKSLMQEYFSM